MTTLSDIQMVNRFWLGDSFSDLSAVKKQSQNWFFSTPEFDKQIRAEYEPLIKAATAGELSEWRSTPQGSLALIILLDQFTRNIYRGTAAAFATDELALQITLAELDSQATSLSAFEKAAFYMPLQHSEKMAVQEKSIAYYSALSGSAIDDHWREYLRGFEDSARKHAAIIERFDRYPHRNDVLGRQSTAEEIDYLSDGGARFGQ